MSQKFVITPTAAEKKQLDNTEIAKALAWIESIDHAKFNLPFRYTIGIKPRCFNGIPVSKARSKYDPEGIAKYLADNFSRDCNIDSLLIALPKKVLKDEAIKQEYEDKFARYKKNLSTLIQNSKSQLLSLVFLSLSLFFEGWIPEMIEYGILTLFGIKRTRGTEQYADKTLQNLIYKVVATCTGVSILEIMGEIQIIKYFCVPDGSHFLFTKAKHVTFPVLYKLVQYIKARANDKQKPLVENELTLVEREKLLDRFEREVRNEELNKKKEQENLNPKPVKQPKNQKAKLVNLDDMSLEQVLEIAAKKRKIIDEEEEKSNKKAKNVEPIVIPDDDNAAIQPLMTPSATGWSEKTPPKKQQPNKPKKASNKPDQTAPEAMNCGV